MIIEIKNSGVYEFTFDIKSELPNFSFFIDYVDRRVTELQMQLNTKIEIIKILDGLSRFEHILHNIFEDDNIIYKNQTEWFYPSIRLNNFITNVNEKNIENLCQIK